MVRIAISSFSKLHGYGMFVAFVVCLAGYLAFIGIKKSELRTVRLLNIGIASLVVFLPLLYYAGYPAEQNALSDLSRGNIGRLLFMVFDANILLILSLWACWLIRSVWCAKDTVLVSRIVMTLVALAGLVLSLILASYHMVGLYLP